MVTFRDLLSAYHDAEPCPGPFPDQCAIRIGSALRATGVSLSSYTGAWCWGRGGPKHTIRAEELANWLRHFPFAGREPMQSLDPKSFQSEAAGKTDIIFFKDYWRRGSESFANRSGDHIDLSNMNRLGKEWTRFSRGVEEFFGIVSHLNDSKSVHFWEVK